MSKLSTESKFLAAVMLGVFEEIFCQSKFGHEPPLIILKRITLYEFQRTMFPTNFMRKTDALSSILYSFINVKFSKSAIEYILPEGLKLSEKERIATHYGKISADTPEEFYRQRYSELLGPIELPESNLLIDIGFFERLENIYASMPDLIILKTILSGQSYVRSRVVETKSVANEFKISEQQYLQFNINDEKYNLTSRIEVELEKQIEHLKTYIVTLQKPMVTDLKNEKSDFSDEVIRGLTNLLKLMSPFHLPEKENFFTLLKWEFQRLRLARILDTYSPADEDFKELAKFLIETKPDCRKKLIISKPIIKNSDEYIQKIFDEFGKFQFTLSKECGQLYTRAQLFNFEAGRFARQQPIIMEELKILDKQRTTAPAVEQKNISKKIENIKRVQKQLENVKLVEAFRSATLEKIVVAGNLLAAEQEWLSTKKAMKAMTDTEEKMKNIKFSEPYRKCVIDESKQVTAIKYLKFYLDCVTAETNRLSEQLKVKLGDDLHDRLKINKPPTSPEPPSSSSSSSSSSSFSSRSGSFSSIPVSQSSVSLLGKSSAPPTNNNASGDGWFKSLFGRKS